MSIAPRFYIIAGEPSGDRLGAALMAGLKVLAPGVEFAGVGGPLMEAEGLTSQFPMEELSVMGVTEVLPRLPGLLRRVRECADAVVAGRFDALITIDSPDFSLRVARKAKAACPDLRTIHYVAPSVWAWREERAVKMARVIDHVLALLPFEPPLMTATGMGCDFVGHPVVAEPQASPAEAQAFRAAHDIAPDAPLVLVLPGSRRSEVARLAATFGEALRPVAAKHPNMRVVVPTLASVASGVIEAVATWPGTPVVLDPRAGSDAAEKRAGFAAADIGLAASGTVSLELAAADTPMVIAYDMNWISRRIIASKLKVDTVTLVNLVSDTRVVPEFLGQACKPDQIAAALNALLAGGPALQEQRAAAACTMARLGRGTEAPGLRAARAVLGAIGQSAAFPPPSA